MKIQTEGRVTKVSLGDVIDEKLDGPALAEAIAGAEVVIFDLDRVKRITSLGIKGWIGFLKLLPDSLYYCFVRCRPNIVTQFNCVDGFEGRGELVSLYLPYACPRCGERHELLVDVAAEKDRLAKFLGPPLQCSRCQVEEEIEDVPEVYLAFASKCKKPSPPEIAQETIAASGVRKHR
jgi:hypothetical protein